MSAGPALRRLGCAGARSALVGLALALAACESPVPPAPGGVDAAARERALRAAEVWRPVDTARLDVTAGPPGSRVPGSVVECTFVFPDTPPVGSTPKFLCRLPDGRVETVKYGAGNRAVQADVFASRLLWLLGFHTDRVDPVRLRCRGCPEDPWRFLLGIDAADPRPAPPTSGVQELSPAVVESSVGPRIEVLELQGVAWSDLLGQLAPDPERARTQRVRREALTLLAAFLAHADGRAASQALACPPDAGSPARCTRPVAYVADLGSTLGHGWRGVGSKAGVEHWAEAPVWRDPVACIAGFPTHREGALFTTAISEPARTFLAERLSALRDEQIRALVEVSGLAEGDAGVDAWADAFRAKRRAIVEHRCPDARVGGGG